MDKTKLTQRLMATFLEEMEEHVRSLNQDLMALEKISPSLFSELTGGDAEDYAEHLKTLFRTVHSLKGAARAVNIQLIEGACHRLEEVLMALRDHHLALTEDLFPLLFSVVDAIEEAGMRLREQQDLADAPLAGMLPRLDAVISAGRSQETGVRSQESGSRSQEAGGGKEEPGEPPAPSISKSELSKQATSEMASSISTPIQPSSISEIMKTEPARAEGKIETQNSATLTADTPKKVRDREETRELVHPLPQPPDAAMATMRVSAEKLDSLLARIGELLVARRRVEARIGDIRNLQENVEQWQAEWHRLEKVVSKILPRNLENAAGGAKAASTLPRNLLERASHLLGNTGTNLRRLNKDLERLTAAMTGDSRLLEQVASPLENEVRQVRMLPFAEACAGLERMVRDLAHTEGKEVELVLEGGSVELDRTILEGLKDPLRHMVRNAVSHGIEPPGKRLAAHKSRTGNVRVSATLRGAQVEVTVQDDGAGLDLEGLREQLRRRHLPQPIDDQDLARTIFLPGISTAAIITDVSGRGVGLDVVKSRVESLHGTVDVFHANGQGTRFILNVPLTLTTLRAILVKASGRIYAFAGTNVQKLVRMGREELRFVAGRETLSIGGPPLPFASLSTLLFPGTPFPGRIKLPQGEARGPDQRIKPREPTRNSMGNRLAGEGKGQPQGTLAQNSRGEKIPVVILAAGEKAMALAVEEFVAEQEILIKSLGSRLRRVPMTAGATLLPSGEIALVLNAASLVRTALRRAPSPMPVVESPAAPAPSVRKRLLVAEDSVTTRTLEKSILEAAGYDVATAVDGQAAWQFLQDNEIDLLVSDVEMPNMDGFALTREVRNSSRTSHLPVVLVTARESEKDKARGIEVGADAYLVKSAFDQHNLLETIAQLL